MLHHHTMVARTAHSQIHACLPAQECWEMMYDTVDTIYDCVRIATGVLSTIKTRPEKMLKGGCPAGRHGHAEVEVG